MTQLEKLKAASRKGEEEYRAAEKDLNAARERIWAASKKVGRADFLLQKYLSSHPETRVTTR